MTSPIIDIRDLHVLFKGERTVHALNGVNITLRQGEVLGLLGESGSGKSVTLRALLRMLPAHRTRISGSISVDGQDVLALDEPALEHMRGNVVSMIFQEPMLALDPVYTIGDQIAETVVRHKGVSYAAGRQRALDMLEGVRIPSARRRLDAYPHEMSGGMRQRVAIAIAIACAPKLLIADEPTTALDVTVQRQILDLLQGEQRQRGMAMILITHDLGVAAGRSDDIMVMYAGRAVETAATREIFRSPRMPYTEALLRSLPRLTDPTHTRLSAIPGRPPDLARRSAGCAFGPRCLYRTERCDTDQPALTMDGGRGYACFYPRGMEPGGTA